jgi:glutamate-1-semialdehyde aminotransferase
MAQFTGTNSKHPSALIEGLYPTHCKGGHGAYLYDTDDVRYLDYICGLGTNFMGYGNDKICQHMHKYLFTGFSHSIPNLLEVEVAEKLKALFPFVDLFKFLKTGSEACSAAVRIARAMTGKSIILSENYHGWHDSFVSLAHPANGVPPTDLFVDPLEQWKDSIPSYDLAAIIVEPVSTDDSPKRIEYLKTLRQQCDHTGTLLIFDEVITGFRYKKYGVCNNYGIEPDLVILGKAMANGMPLAAVGGKRSIMDDRRWFVSSSYSGEILSLAACWKTIDLLQSDHTYNLENLRMKGQQFIDQFNSMPSDVKIEGYATRGVFRGSDLNRGIFFQEMAKLKVLFGPSWFYNFDHMAHNEEILDLCWLVKTRIERGQTPMEYALPKSPFSKEVRDNE